MSYNMCQLDQHFRLDVGKMEAAFLALQEWEKQEIERNPGYADLGCFPLGDAETLEEALEELDWQPETDDAGNIVGLGFTGEKLCDEDAWLNAIAPYVEAGSYLSMVGEDYYAWRWYFDGKTCEEFAGKLTYPGCPAAGGDEDE